MLSLFRTGALRADWLRHEFTIDLTRMARIIFESKSEGRRKVGRSRLRWLEHEEK
jgi:hypothetical protein